MFYLPSPAALDALADARIAQLQAEQIVRDSRTVVAEVTRHE